MNFFLFLGLIAVAYAAIVFAVMKMEKKKLEVFIVSRDELLRSFTNYLHFYMPGEKDPLEERLASDELAAELDKLEKAERDKFWKGVERLPYPTLKAVELTGNGVEFTFCLTRKTREAKPAELAELKAKLVRLLEDRKTSYKQGQISAIESIERSRRLLDDDGIEVKVLDEDFIFTFFGSSFGLEAWREPDSLEEWGKIKPPAISRKITGVELTNNGIQVTTIRV